MKTKILHITLSSLVLLCIIGWTPFDIFSGAINNEIIGSKKWIEKEAKLIHSQAENLDPKVLELGLTAYSKAREEGLDNKELLTIIDYSKPSTERRLWVVDVKNAKVLFNTWVAHGKNSGKVNATSFSNAPGSLKSSLGVFLTTNEPYIGNNGYSLRVQGLEAGINDKAYARNVVFHGAWYAAADVAKRNGLLGRSWVALRSAKI